MKWKAGAVMGDELETREKLLESAMAEFSENGYMKASLRKICADAGVTTGALYFFFKNKNDLFKAIVDEPLKELCRLLTEHYMQDAQDMDSDDPAVLSAEYHIDTHTCWFVNDVLHIFLFIIYKFVYFTKFNIVIIYTLWSFPI